MRIPAQWVYSSDSGSPISAPVARARSTAASANTRLADSPERPDTTGRAEPASRLLRSRARAEVIAFANQKGGVAKTTTTLNLAVAFAEAGHRVLAIDMDPQGNLTMSQGIDPDSVEKSMYDVLVHHHPDPRRDPEAGSRCCLRLDRPRRRRDRDEHADRPRALAPEGAEADRARTTTSSASTRHRRWGS